MKILKDFTFVVFAVLTLANVAGCAVNVEPSPEKDGGGTASGNDDATGDDVSPGDDADVGDDDGSTTDDDTDPTRDGGGNPDDATPCGRVCGKLVQCGVVTDGADRETCKELCRAGAQPDAHYQCILDHECGELAGTCPAPGTDGGGGQVNEDGGTTVTVDENGNADLGDDCEEDVEVRPAPFFEYSLEGHYRSWHLVEMDFNGYIEPISPEEDPDAPSDLIQRTGRESDMVGKQFSSRGLVRIVNRSPDTSVEFLDFEAYLSREDRIDGAEPVWSHHDGYPIVGPGQALTIGQLETGIYYPLCTVHLENLEE